MKRFMPWSWRRGRLGVASALLLVGAGAVILDLAQECALCEAATTVLLQGDVATNCTIDVTAAGSSTSLPLTTTGAQRVTVGTAVQSCNKRVGYSLTVGSANCATGTAGAKLIDPVSAEQLAYSAEFANPATGGSSVSVTGLLASACAGQIGRDVTNAKTTNETSTIYVNFSGDAGLAAGTYQDTLTITMNVK